MERILPMLLHSAKPFNSDDYIFEVKFDGIRCVAYLSDGGVVLTNRHGGDIGLKFPELSSIYKCCAFDCVLDGEIVAFKDGKPDLYQLLRKKRAAKAEFIAFDILYFNGQSLTDKPLMQRKKILAQNVLEGNSLAVSRYIEGEGTAFFDVIKERGLEGIVAKKKDSLYYPAKRSRDWLKIKVMHEEDFAVAGFICDEKHSPKEVILAQKGLYAGKINVSAYKTVQKQLTDFVKKQGVAPETFKDIKNAVWLKRGLFCKIEYLEKTASGGLRHHAFKGLYESAGEEE